MKTESTTLNAAPRQRVASVDTLRGLTILLMVFVNDLGKSAPSWMHHIQPPESDGMTLADIVFPFFLFIVGVSIPLAVDTARRKGVSLAAQIRHLLTRTLGLLVMGLVGVNLSEIVSMDAQWWGLLSYIAIILAWCIVPRGTAIKRTVFTILKIAGIVGLVVMLAVYRREPVSTNVLFLGTVEDWQWLRTSWWGILGLIGWAYLVAATIYLLVGPRREWLVGATALLMLMFVVSNHGGLFTRIDDKPWLGPVRPLVDALQWLVDGIQTYVSLGSQLGSLPGIVMCGCVLGTILTPDSTIPTTRERIQWSLMYAFGLFLAGAVMDTFAGINKISGTPTWGLWCASLATLSWLVLYLIIDVWKFSGWTLAIRPAGANPLIAYLLHPIILFVLGVTGLGATLRAYSESPSAWIAVLGSLAMAIVVCALTAVIAASGLRVRV